MWTTQITSTINPERNLECVRSVERFGDPNRWTTQCFIPESLLESFLHSRVVLTSFALEDLTTLFQSWERYIRDNQSLVTSLFSGSNSWWWLRPFAWPALVTIESFYSSFYFACCLSNSVAQVSYGRAWSVVSADPRRQCSKLSLRSVCQLVSRMWSCIRSLVSGWHWCLTNLGNSGLRGFRGIKLFTFILAV